MKRSSLDALSATLFRLNLPRDHITVVHSSLLTFGLIEGGLAGVMQVLDEVLGARATILMPAFTFSFGASRHWDSRTSKAETGALCEYFRKQAGVIRTVHPFHSLCVRGPHAEEFTACTNLSSFGEGSPFERLVQMDAINLALGTEFVGGATFLHHTEEVAAVPYRFYKEFPGRVCDGRGALMPNTYRMFAREISEDHEYDNVWDPVWEHLVDQDLVRQERLNGANLFSMRIKAAHASFLSRLKADPYYCAVRKTKSRG